MKFFVTITILLFVGLLRDGTGQELKEIVGYRKCYFVNCPEGTFSCSKYSKTTDDLQNVDVLVTCNDAQGKVLETGQQQIANPFPGSAFAVMSLEGGVLGSSKISPMPDAYPSDDNKNYDQVETFNK